MGELRSSGRGQDRKERRTGSRDRSRSRSPIGRNDQTLSRLDRNDVIEKKGSQETEVEENQGKVILPTSEHIPDIDVLRATLQKLNDQVKQAEDNVEKSRGLPWEESRSDKLNIAKKAKDTFDKFMHKYDDPRDNYIIKQRARDNWDQWEASLRKVEHDPDYKVATKIAEALNEASAELKAKQMQEQPLQDAGGETSTSQVESADTTESTDLSRLTKKELKARIQRDIDAAIELQVIKKWPSLQTFKNEGKLYLDFEKYKLDAFEKGGRIYITDNMSYLSEREFKLTYIAAHESRRARGDYGIMPFESIKDAYTYIMSNKKILKKILNINSII